MLNEDLLLQQRVACLNKQQYSEHELKHLLDKRTSFIFRKVETTARSFASQAERDKRILRRSIAGQEFNFTKSKVEVLRWRQRSALLKVQLSSAEEDARRYQRLDSIVMKQFELEQESKVAAQHLLSDLHDGAQVTHRNWVEGFADLQQLRAEIEEHTAQRLSQTKQLQLTMTKAEGLRQRLQAAEHEQTRLEHCVAAAEGAQAALEEEVRKLKSDNILLEKERCYSKSTAEQRSADCRELQMRADTLQQEVSNKMVEIVSLRDSLQNEKQQVTSLHAQVKLLTQQLDSKRAQLQQLEEQAAARTVGAFISQLESPLVEQPSKDNYADHHAANHAFDQDQIGLDPSAALSDRDVLKKPTDPEKAAKKQVKKGPASRVRQAGQAQRNKLSSSAAGSNAKSVDRTRRERNKSQPYWMGSHAEEHDSAKSTEQHDLAMRRGASAAPTNNHTDKYCLDNNKVPPNDCMEQHRQPEEQEDQEIQAKENNLRTRQKPQKQQMPLENAVSEVMAAAGAADIPRGRRGKLKRPQGEIKTDLTNVWGGTTPVPASSGPEIAQVERKSKSNLRPTGTNADELGGNANGAMEDGPFNSKAHQQKVKCRVQDRPLAPLNQRTLAAAANMVTKSNINLKGNMQKAITARGENHQQPQKRKLLPISTSRNVVGDILPAQALFGGSFKVPKLTK